MLVKQSLTAQRATRRAQKSKEKFETQRVCAQSARDQATRLGLRKATHKGTQELQASDGLGSSSEKENLCIYYDLYFCIQIYTLNTLWLNYYYNNNHNIPH